MGGGSSRSRGARVVPAKDMLRPVSLGEDAMRRTRMISTDVVRSSFERQTMADQLSYQQLNEFVQSGQRNGRTNLEIFNSLVRDADALRSGSAGSAPPGSDPRGSTPRGSTPRGSTPRGSASRGSTLTGSASPGSTGRRGAAAASSALQAETPQRRRSSRVSSADFVGGSFELSASPLRRRRAVEEPDAVRFSTGHVERFLPTSGGAMMRRRAILFRSGLGRSMIADPEEARRARLSQERHFNEMSDEAKALVTEALGSFFPLSGGSGGGGGIVDGGVASVLGSMRRKLCPAGYVLMRQGEIGDTLYAVESGVLEVRVDGTFRRNLGPGARVGELALLYDAPRSATVTCTCPCVLWTLKRDACRRMAAVSFASVSRRCRMLFGAATLKGLDPNDLCRLSNVLRSRTLADGEVIYEEDSPTGECVLLEEGTVEAVRRSGAREVVAAGTFIGDGVLRAHAELSGGWLMAPGGRTALPPATFVARGPVVIGTFSISTFERVLGPPRRVVVPPPPSAVGQLSRGGEEGSFRSRLLQLPQTPDGSERGAGPRLADLKELGRLGEGSFGRVTLVKDGADQRRYALKSMRKASIVSGRQVEHAQSERKVLRMLNHPFVLKLFATFQSETEIFFLTEALGGGELLGIIHQGCSGQGTDGLPAAHVAFYAANVVAALAHMHERGVAYRDLKPENLIVDSEGYLRVIDFGFAKRIPYVVDVHGEAIVHPRSFTMCGTPEYLAPEFVLDSGHDHAVDLWALGVLIFEMAAARTPFMPQDAERESDVLTVLFTNIVCVRKLGIPFPEDFDERCGGSSCRDIVKKLLNFAPSQRLGNLAGKMGDVRAHPFFAGVHWERLEAKELEAPWRPTHLFSQLRPSSPGPELPEGATSAEDAAVDQRLFRGFGRA